MRKKGFASVISAAIALSTAVLPMTAFAADNCPARYATGNSDVYGDCSPGSNNCWKTVYGEHYRADGSWWVRTMEYKLMGSSWQLRSVGSMRCFPIR